MWWWWWKNVLAATLLSTVTVDLQGVYGFTYTPGGVPLAVKSPFLSTWKLGSVPMGRDWPLSGGNLGITAWVGFARVDDVLYSFLGAPAASGSWFGRSPRTKDFE
ncbi:hypothetical protein FRC16_004616, partial [Serendipita sp. 398]